MADRADMATAEGCSTARTGRARTTAPCARELQHQHLHQHQTAGGRTQGNAPSYQLWEPPADQLTTDPEAAGRLALSARAVRQRSRARWGHERASSQWQLCRNQPMPLLWADASYDRDKPPIRAGACPVRGRCAPPLRGRGCEMLQHGSCSETRGTVCSHESDMDVEVDEGREGAASTSMSCCAMACTAASMPRRAARWCQHAPP